MGRFIFCAHPTRRKRRVWYRKRSKHPTAERSAAGRFAFLAPSPFQGRGEGLFRNGFHRSTRDSSNTWRDGWNRRPRRQRRSFNSVGSVGSCSNGRGGHRPPGRMVGPPLALAGTARWASQVTRFSQPRRRSSACAKDTPREGGWRMLDCGVSEGETFDNACPLVRFRSLRDQFKITDVLPDGALQLMAKQQT